MGKCQPSAGDDAAWGQYDDAAFRGQALGQVFEHARLADAGFADELQHSVWLEQGFRLGDAFDAWQAHATYLVLDVLKRVVGGFRQSGVHVAQISARAKAKAVLFG